MLANELFCILMYFRLVIMCVEFGFVFNLKVHLWTVFVSNVNVKSLLYL